MVLSHFMNVRNVIKLFKSVSRNIQLTVPSHINPVNVQEVRIPVPWGHIAGKWWGDSNKQPILTLHGWQDNAGSFDPLLELLPESYSFLVLDTPGHGFSSHFPRGMFYNHANYLIMCRRIQTYYNWENPVTLLGHSEGGMIAFLFSAVYPECVSALITLDVVRPIPRRPSHFTNFGEKIEIAVTKSLREGDANPKYTFDEIEKRWIKGTSGSLKSHAVKVLMRRGVRLDSESGKYSYTRDPRVKIWSLLSIDENQALVLASSIKCKFLAVKFSEGKFWDLSLSRSPNYLNTLKESAKSFKTVTVEGTHHCHLNDPESVAPILKEFIEKNSLS